MGTGAGRPAVVEGLDVNEVKDGLIIYAPEADRVHYLNTTAAVVFTFCDGTNDPAEIAELVGQAYGLGAAPAAVVDACLAQLHDEGLLR